MIDSADSFSSTYAAARAKFRETALAAGAVLEAVRHPERGPDRDELFVDIARLGPASAERMVVLISGTHGVEGFCGSGVQVDLLRRGEFAALPDGIGVLLLHAINPWGFAWLRRTTHENIDLNRNWVNFNHRPPDNSGYRELHALLCPSTWSAETRDAGQAALDAYAATHGAEAAKNALGGGQYAFADGLYYGGAVPSWSRLTQVAIFQHYLFFAERIAIIDFHTGLGPWGVAEQIMSAAATSAVFKRASHWYGSALRSTVDGDSLGARIGGDGLSASIELLSHAQVTPVFLEIGTRPRAFIIAANCADNWLHAHGDLQSDAAIEIKRQVRDAYYGDRDDWKGMVAGQSVLMVRQALAGIQLNDEQG